MPKPQKQRPKANSTPRTIEKPQMSKLKTMLDSEGTVDLACEMIIAADEPKIYEAMLEGCTLVDGRLVPNRVFRSTQEWRSRALMRIVSHAPATSPIAPHGITKLAFASQVSGERGTRSQLKQVADSVLTALPEEIGRFAQLLELSLVDTMISELPSSIGGLVNLRSLVATYAHRRFFSDLIGERCPLRHIPETIGNLQRLETLDVSGSSIKALPSTIGNLVSLKHLNVAGCPLEQLPESIGNLEQLETLDISGSALTRLPDSIGRLRRLKKLIVADWHWTDGPLAVLPESVGGLSSLEHLDLSGTRLTSLPDAIGGLHNLCYLSLPSSMVHIPLELGSLNLKTLVLSDDSKGEALSRIVLDICRRGYELKRQTGRDK